MYREREREEKTGNGRKNIVDEILIFIFDVIYIYLIFGKPGNCDSRSQYKLLNVRLLAKRPQPHERGQ